MPNKIEISKVEIKIGNNKTELSIKEAMELRDILNDTFPQKEVMPVSIPYYPLWPYGRRWDDDWQVSFTYPCDPITYTGNTLSIENTGYASTAS